MTKKGMMAGLVVFAFALSANTALAVSEVTGTLSASTDPAQSGGTLNADTTGGGSTNQGGGSTSGSSRRSLAAGSSQPENDIIIILDDGSVASPTAEFGTGGGYDPTLERYLSAIGGAESEETADVTLSPSDAVAFNTADNPLLESDLTAAVSDSGFGTGKTIAAVALGLALLGLAGYAVNALMAYRRENDL